MRISDWSSDVCSSDLEGVVHQPRAGLVAALGQAAEAQAAGAVDHQRAGQLAGVRLAGQVGFGIAQHVAEKGADVITRSRSEEHTSELQSLMRISYAVFCLKKKNNTSTRPREKKKQKHTQNNN